jgi:hypothetical protein
MGNDPGTPGNGGATPGNGGTGTPSVPMCNADGVALGAPRLWRLTHAQLGNSINDVFGFRVPAVDTLPGESRLDGFANASDRLSLSPVLFDYYDRVAEQVGTQAVMRAGTLLKCPLAMLGQGTCLADFLAAVGTKAWRRPLEAAETEKLTRLYRDASAAAGPDIGFKMLVQGLVLSANFLYRTELGEARSVVSTDGSVRLGQYEIASALSFMLWDAPPDAELLDQARQGKLTDGAALTAQARRMLGVPDRAPGALFSFVQQWLETEDYTQKPKDPEAYPIFNPEIAKLLEQETSTFVKEALLDPAGGVKQLLTASHGYVNATTAKLYGVPAPAGTGLVRVELDKSQRRGIMTQASFLGAHAEPIHTSVSNRGRFFREEILCAPVPPPPADFKFDEKIITEDMTAREKFEVHAKNPACGGCHKLFDGLGFALENYDAIGQYRTTEKGKTIDASGVIEAPGGGELRFKNFVDLMDQLSARKDVYDCFASQYLQYVTGRVELPECERQAVARAFIDSGNQLPALITAIVSAPSFVGRKN